MRGGNMPEKEKINTEKLDKAIRFAIEAHKNDPRKGSKTPYILHPIEAAAIVATMTDDIEVMAAAVLHDTVEDNKSISLEEIEERFGTRIKELVAEESEKKYDDEKGTWKIRKQATIDKLKDEKNEDVKIITLGDKLSNMRAIYKDYVAIGDELWSRFNQTNKNEHGWYYKSIGELLKSLSKYPAYQEYYELVNKVFDIHN